MTPYTSPAHDGARARPDIAKEHPIRSAIRLSYPHLTPRKINMTREKLAFEDQYFFLSIAMLVFRGCNSMRFCFAAGRRWVVYLGGSMELVYLPRFSCLEGKS